MVIPDQAAKRKDYEEEVLKTFYLSNTVTPQDLTEIVTGLRQLFDLKRVQQLNSQNAIIIRATPDVLTLVGKVLDDIDKAKPEVVIQVEVLEARTDRLRDSGNPAGANRIDCDKSECDYDNPGTVTGGAGGTATTSTTTNNITLNTLSPPE